jgi:hypothetical protein
MATSKEPTDPAYQPEKPEVDLTPHPLVTRLNPEGDPPPNLVMLAGFIGPSKKPDGIRLYLDLSFNTFIDIPVAGIVSTQSVDSEDENSPTRVWVHGDARLDVVQNVSQTMEASYLRGWIARNYLRSTMPASGLMALRPPPTMGAECMAPDTVLCSYNLWCVPSYPICPSDPCERSINVRCSSHRAICPL